MKHSFLLLFSVLMSLYAVPQELDNISNTSFEPGEKLRYKLKYGFLTAAEATLQVFASDQKFEGKPVYHLVAEGKTSGSFDIFYKVRDRYDSYVDQATLLPYLYTENIRESNYKRTDKVRFYQSERKITGNKGTFKGAAKTFDLASAFYFARNIDLSNIRPGKTITMSYFLKDEVTDFTITYVGKEMVKSQLGTINCLKFSPQIQPGRIFKKDSKLYLWITDDKNRIPVKAQVEVIVGAITMELASATGLKYPAPYSK